MTLPTVITKAGLQPQAPANLLAQLLAAVSATNPDYTANLPGSLVEDVSSTDVAAIALCDSARVELVNSLTPFGANAFILSQLGQIYGVQPGEASNTSVFCVFSGPPGQIIAVGFTVSDGTYQYTVQDGGVVGAGGTSSPLFCLATIPGSWVVPANSVTNVVTSVPTGVTVSVTNPTAGTPGGAAESEEEYRSAVLQAGKSVAQGMSTFLKTTLRKISGVQSRLISAVQQSGGGWEIIVGGGDPYEVAYAIYQALFDISSLVGSELLVSGITRANPGVVTTVLNHGFSTGRTVQIAGANPSNYDGSFNATVINEKQFSIGIDTSGFPAYVSGGVVTPNLRNVSVSIQDPPDTYGIVFVNPPQQTVSMSVTWNTTAVNFVSQAAVAQLGAPALADYVNNLPVGVPMNLFELQTVFMAAVASVIPPQLLTRMVFAVDINSVSTPPDAGTGIIAGDPESYFQTSAASITITQG